MEKCEDEPGTSGDNTFALIDKLSRYEQLGQEVILSKRALIELDERRQKCREAVRQIRNQQAKEMVIRCFIPQFFFSSFLLFLTFSHSFSFEIEGVGVN